MSFLIYQRSDPRYPDWIPLTSQQVRLRNLIQVIGVNVEAGEREELYYTLHLTPMSAPFLTSERVGGAGAVVVWKEIEPRKIPAFVPLSAPGFVIRVWSSLRPAAPLLSWGVVMNGLHYLGPHADPRPPDFAPSSLIFRLPFGSFTALHALHPPPPHPPERFTSYFYPKLNELARHSYNVKSLTALHRTQRSLLEEVELARRLRYHISLFGYSTETDSPPPPTLSPLHSSSLSSLSSSLALPKSISQFSINPANVQLSGRALARVQTGRRKLKLKEEIEAMQLRVKMLKDERGRCEGRVHRLKKKAVSLEDPHADLMAHIHLLGRERDRLREFKSIVQSKKNSLGEKRGQLNTRKKQLISELLLIYPLQLVGGSKRYSISEVQLPNAEDYGSESGSQISVALGYTAHLVAMLSFFLGIPLRYPVRHFGSRSRIIDHITTQIPNKEREFPLYFRGREDVYSKYAVYLLNKNIAQLRWYCGLSTPDLRATLPNLHNVLTSRLTIPGWPPSPSDSCEMAEELTEETHHQLFRNDLSLSLDGGLDQISHIQLATPKTIDNIHIQSWLSASVSDLDHAEVAGGNSVPVGEIQHGRAQNRFLSGWKKKTYSESEEIDPRWLTNSLNLELEFGTRPSITPSPPLRLPVLPLTLFNNDPKEAGYKSRKRRVGRVETLTSGVFHPPSHHTTDNNNSPQQLPHGGGSPTSGLPFLDASHAPLLTPNHAISEVEHQINLYERRKSICETGRGGGGSPTQAPPPLPSLPSPSHSKPSLLELPLVDNYPTTDEEKMDDTIADVVRKISLMEMQLGRFPLKGDETNFPEDAPSPTTTPTSHLSSLTILPEDEGGATHSSETEEGGSSGEGGPTPDFQPAPGGVGAGLERIIECVEAEPSDRGTVPEKSNSFCDDSVVTNIPRVGVVELVDGGDDKVPVCDSNGVVMREEKGEECGEEGLEDSSSLWFRTEALLSSSQSFNLVKRRISESN